MCYYLLWETIPFLLKDKDWLEFLFLKAYLLNFRGFSKETRIRGIYQLFKKKKSGKEP
jgi:hypothetical protein